LGEDQEPRKPISIETKRLKEVARYSLDVGLSKKALRQVHKQDRSGRFRNFKEWAMQQWIVSIYKTENGFTVEFDKAERS